MALSDCYMLRDIQHFNGEEILNVFFYQDLLLASTAQNVVEAYVAGVLPKVKAMQQQSFYHDKIDCVNLSDASNFYEFVLHDGGGQTGEALPPFNAVTFGLRLNSRALRPGSKRIAGVPESANNGGVITDGTYLALMEAYRIQMKSILLSGILETFQPIVVKRVLYTVPDSSPAREAYRLPENDGEFVFGNVIECVTTARVSHQTSRGNAR